MPEIEETSIWLYGETMCVDELDTTNVILYKKRNTSYKNNETWNFM